MSTPRYVFGRYKVKRVLDHRGYYQRPEEKRWGVYTRTTNEPLRTDFTSRCEAEQAAIGLNKEMDEMTGRSWVGVPLQ